MTPGFRDYALEQLGRSAPGARARAMFGGVSVATTEGTFALIDDDIVYLKGDRQNRDQFVAAGWPAFHPFGADGSAMGYFAVPGELLEDAEALAPWVLLAREAAHRAPTKKRKG
ncbi:MAG: TfoX/Sxy family protein [Gemmatimonadota bacterium]